MTLRRLLREGGRGAGRRREAIRRKRQQRDQHRQTEKYGLYHVALAPMYHRPVERARLRQYLL